MIRSLTSRQLAVLKLIASGRLLDIRLYDQRTMRSLFLRGTWTVTTAHGGREIPVLQQAGWDVLGRYLVAKPPLRKRQGPTFIEADEKERKGA